MKVNLNSYSVWHCNCLFSIWWVPMKVIGFESLMIPCSGPVWGRCIYNNTWSSQASSPQWYNSLALMEVDTLPLLYQHLEIRFQFKVYSCLMFWMRTLFVWKSEVFIKSHAYFSTSCLHLVGVIFSKSVTIFHRDMCIMVPTSILRLSGIDRGLVGCVVDKVWRTIGKPIIKTLMSLDMCRNGISICIQYNI